MLAVVIHVGDGTHATSPRNLLLATEVFAMVAGFGVAHAR